MYKCKLGDNSSLFQAKCNIIRRASALPGTHSFIASWPFSTFPGAYKRVIVYTFKQHLPSGWPFHTIFSFNLLFSLLDALKQLNQSADPCTDFYEYVCGGWQDENALKPGETSVTGFSLVIEKSYNVLKGALDNAQKNYSNVRAC